MDKSPAEKMHDALQVFLLNPDLREYLDTHDQSARDQAQRAVTAYLQSRVHCSCECPCWGREGEPTAIVRCDCGREEAACVECLQAGRITQCMTCSQPQTIYIQTWVQSDFKWQDVRPCTIQQLRADLKRMRKLNPEIRFRAVRRTFTEEGIDV